MLKKENAKFFIGIDLGGKEKKTTGVCILEKSGKNIFSHQDWCKKCQDIKEFILDLNLIEVFPTIVEKICNKNLFLVLKKKKFPCKTANQKSALICAILAYLHFEFKTRYLGYKDGFLFLPKMSFWKINWRRKFYQAWMERSRLKYKFLITKK